MKELAHCLMGSQNYFLDGPDSDKDYKVFVYPTFNDLYKNHRLDKGDLPSEYPRDDHYSPMDVRTFASNLLKGNVNCLEYVFSTEWVVKDKDFEFLASAARKLFESGYLLVCWETFFASLEGMVKNSLDRYGVTHKSMSRAYYFYVFASSLVVDNFKMTNHSWRGNKWNNDVRAMRFNENAWLPSREELEKTLGFLKGTAAESVKRMRKYRPELVEELKQQGKEFEGYVKWLVANKVCNELKMGDY